MVPTMIMRAAAHTIQKSIADAMRELLETFRLPGEAHPIARITEVFAEHFFSFRPRTLRQFLPLCQLTFGRSGDRGPGCHLRASLLCYHAQYRST